MVGVVVIAVVASAVACSSSSGPPRQLVGAGLTTCPDDAACTGGLDCEHIEVLDDPNPGTCTHRCSDDEDCAADKLCAEDCSVGLENSCLVDCSKGAACPSGYACGITTDIDGSGVQVCVPSGWLDGTRHILVPPSPPLDCE